MRILVHEYAGHAFSVQLARELARRGHSVRYVFSAGFQSPRGNLRPTEDDPETLEIVPVRLSDPFDKNGLLQRRSQEIAVGRSVGHLLEDFEPDVVLSGNAPLDTQLQVARASRRAGASFVFWLQDLYGEALRRLLPGRVRIPGAGAVIAEYYAALEAAVLRGSAHVVAITDDFVAPLLRRGVERDRISVIENWAALSELPVQPRDNAWSAVNMRAPGLRIVYSGTLGMKHDHRLLVEIARARIGHVYVFSEGRFAQQLAAEAVGIPNLSVRNWVRFDDLPAMLSAADILVAMIDDDAGVFSVPSKVLSYLGIGRPIVASIPEANLARRTIEGAGAGLVVAPGETGAMLDALRRLAADPALRQRLGDNGWAHAAAHFDIGRVGDAFERVLRGAVRSSESATGPMPVLPWRRVGWPG